jgi:hypothetical protein
MLRQPLDNIEWTSHNWEQFYLTVKGKVIPYDQPTARGQPVQINLFCDVEHALCVIMTHWSTMGTLLVVEETEYVQDQHIW